MNNKIKTILIAAIIIFESGVAISQDSVNLPFRTQNNFKKVVPGSSILNSSKHTIPDKYYFSASVIGGVSLLSGGFFPFDGISRAITSPNLNLSMMWFFSASKGLKLDAGYTHVKSDNFEIEKYNTENSRETVIGGDVSLYSVKGNFLLGRFDPKRENYSVSFAGNWRSFLESAGGYY